MILHPIRIALAPILFALILIGCTASLQPTVSIEQGELLVEQAFDAEEVNNPDYPAWDTFTLGRVNFGITEGQYVATSSGGGNIWALNNTAHSDVIIEVTAELTIENPTASYGVMCRANPANDGFGYYFLLRGDGSYGIRESNGERTVPLVNWTEDRVVRTNRPNTLRVACVGDTLQMMINNRLVAEVQRDWLETGYAGFAINGQGGFGIAATFDNMRIWSASLAD